MKLNLGAGNREIEGFLSVDFRKLNTTDIVEDISTLKSIEDESCSTVIAHHVIEHFPHHEVPYVLYNWWRILKPDGELLLETPNLLWIIKQFNEEYSGSGDINNRRKIINFLYGGQEYKGNYHNNIFDVSTLAFALTNAGFEFKFSYGDENDQNIRVSCRKKIINLSKYNEIWINNKAKVFGDRLLTYPIALVFKYYYPNKKVKMVYNNDIEKKLFSVANGIDGIINNLVKIPKDVFVLSESFDVDAKWKPWVYGIKDNPKVWGKMRANGLAANIPIKKIEKYSGRIKYNQDFVKFIDNNLRTIVAIFIDSCRPHMSLPYEISGWGFDNYYELCKSMPDIKFIAFYGPKDIPYPKFNLPNVFEIGELNAIEQIYMSQYCDLLVSISTSVSAMIWPMTSVPIIVLNSQEINNESVWAGIPDKCVLPPSRYRHLFGNNDNISFIKPPITDHKFLWHFRHYWCGVIKEREMIPVSEIKVEQVSTMIESKLRGGRSVEFGLQPGIICNSCSLFKDMQICVYHHHKEILESGN